jgi:hypothetical protein
MRPALLAAAGLVLLSSACAGTDATPTVSASLSAAPECRGAVAAAADAGDAEAAEAALEAAIGACLDLAAWEAATAEFDSALEELDPQEFLMDRCINGPPDLVQTSLCEAVNAER